MIFTGVLALICCTIAIILFYLFLFLTGQDIETAKFITVAGFGYGVTFAAIIISEIWSRR